MKVPEADATVRHARAHEELLATRVNECLDVKHRDGLWQTVLPGRPGRAPKEVREKRRARMRSVLAVDRAQAFELRQRQAALILDIAMQRREAVRGLQSGVPQPQLPGDLWAGHPIGGPW